MEDKARQLKKVEDLVFSFFCESSDFNGIALRDISERLYLDYRYSIDQVKQLVSDGVVTIQSSTNPHIIGFTHHPIPPQLDILEHAKDITVSKRTYGNFEIVTEETEYPICVLNRTRYPRH